ncbi:MAG: TrkA family potassium uptake protein [Erysipelotrichaceae bacterium]|nr:TrkA family potassium uptake protein [Erysipelotrichaceae bacterium]
MKLIIIGCGRLGSGLANKLFKEGHEITVVDNNPEAFLELDPSFKGKTIVGIGFDQDVLSKAKIKEVDALIACTSSDDTNALIARLAQNFFRVPKVIARLYDQHKAEIYQSLGIQAVSTTAWGIEKASGILRYGKLDILNTIGDGKVDLIRVEAPVLLEGKTVNELYIEAELQVVTIRRYGNTFIPTLGSVILSKDILYIVVLSTEKPHLEALLGLS